MPTAGPTFAILDWIVLGLYLGLLLVSGVWLARRQRVASAREYFVGDKSMPVWAVAMSVLATTLSAATFIGAPVETYSGDLTYLSTNIGGVVALVIVATLFLPAFYKHQVTSVYELLERRFGVVGRRSASATFMLGRVFASGARLFAAAVPLTMILFGTLDPSPGAILVAIGVLTLAGVLYCYTGGIKSIIWTDVVQSVVFIGAGLAAVWVLLHRIDAPVGEIVRTLAETRVGEGVSERSKLTVLTLGIPINFSQPYTLITAVLGSALLMTAAYGTDQDLAQRMLTCKSAVAGSKSAVLSVIVGLPVTVMFLLIGLGLFVFYKCPSVVGAAAPAYQPAKVDHAFTVFILREMPVGIKGLMMAGLFAIALTSLMSALNAMSSTLLADFYRPLVRRRDEQHYLRAGRLGVAVWGVVLGMFAGLCVYWQRSSGETIIQFALGVMGFAYAGLLGVYFTCLLTRRGNAMSCLAALAAGFVVVLLLQPAVWDAVMPGKWMGVRVAFPWRLTFGAVVAFLVAVAGRPNARPSRFLIVLLGLILGMVLIVGVFGWWVVNHTSWLGRPTVVLALPSYSNSVGMRFRQIPAGQFVIPAKYTVGGVDLTVSMSGQYWMAETETTQSQWAAVMNPGEEVQGDGSLPVSGVTWFQAEEFCKRLSALDGRRYRLPTQAEWEHAARGGRGDADYIWNWNDKPEKWCWSSSNSAGVIHPVGALLPNGYGLFDVAGNVREWCSDWCAVPFPYTGTVIDPLGPSQAQSKLFSAQRLAMSPYRSMRGSDYSCPVHFFKLWEINGSEPDLAAPYVGFRVLMEDHK